MENNLANKIERTMGSVAQHEEVLNALFSEDLVSLTKEISIKITDGKGTYNVGWIPTLGKTVKGTVTLLKPKGGTWNVVASDATAKKTIYHGYGIKEGQPITFEYKTSFWGITPKITLEWSIRQDTTAVVQAIVGFA